MTDEHCYQVNKGRRYKLAICGSILLMPAAAYAIAFGILWGRSHRSTSSSSSSFIPIGDSEWNTTEEVIYQVCHPLHHLGQSLACKRCTLHCYLQEKSFSQVVVLGEIIFQILKFIPTFPSHFQGLACFVSMKIHLSCKKMNPIITL